MHVDTADFDVDEDGQDTMLGYAGDETENVALLTSSMSTHLGKKLSVVAPRAAAQQQRNHNKPEQQTEQAIQEKESRKREKGRKGEGEKKEKERGERGKREEETGEEGKEVQEETDKEVKKDVTDWVEGERKGS